MLACAMCATTLASKFSHLLSASSLLYTSSDMSGSLQPHRASIDIWVSILSPATAQPIDARLHFICTSCPARASRWKKKKKREWDRRRRSHLRGELWRTQHRQRVSVRHEHGARQLLRKTGRNTKLVLVSLQVLYSQSFSTFSMLLFAEQHFSRLFVFFFFSFRLSPSSRALHVHWLSGASVQCSHFSHDMAFVFANVSILCSTYDRRTDFTSCVRRWCDTAEGRNVTFIFYARIYYPSHPA